MRAHGFLVAALFLLATPAFAQYDECVAPSTVPLGVFETIGEEADVLFGEGLPEGTCNAIAKQGTANCRTQTKAAASCNQRSINAVYEIGLKQCNQLDQPEKSDCIDDLKVRRANDRDAVDDSREIGLNLCDGEFEAALRGACEGLVKP